MLKNKLKYDKWCIPIFVIIINLIFFIFINIFFELRYETVDDFTIMKIISKLDGTYSIYSVYIHPILSFLIVLLFMTGISINWYTICLIFIQFLSFTTIGIILINRDKKFGTVFYLLIIIASYSKILKIINYTSVATIAILAGCLTLMCSMKRPEIKKKMYGIILITIGIMLRWQSAIIVFPFYIIYVIYYTIKTKNYKSLKTPMIVFTIFIMLYLSNYFIYNSNSIYKKYTEFNKIRTYFFDSNIVDYNENKNIFEQNNWSYVDWQIFYSYSLADEEFYTTENLLNIKQKVDEDSKLKNDTIYYLLEYFYKISIDSKYLYLSLVIVLLVIMSFIIKKKRCISGIYFLTGILLTFILIYLKPVYRVLISVYSTTFIMLAYILTEEENKDTNKELIDKIVLCIFIVVLFFYTIIESKNNIFGLYKKDNFKYLKDIVEYTNEHKENAYVYPNTFGNISLAYSIYERIPDDTFINLRHMGDWDVYNEEMYQFKKRYNLNNIMEDLYKKDNLYVIDGTTYLANNMKIKNHIDVIKQYLKQHYKKNIDYNIVKEFNGYAIYKFYDVKEGE